MDYKRRYKETLRISGDLWDTYKKYSITMDKAFELPEPEQRDWWNRVNQEFMNVVQKYYKTTHEFYAQEYAIACLDDLNTVWKMKLNDKM